MGIETIDYICKKLGTTVENLIPTAIKYGIHQERILGIVGICVFVFGLFMIVVTFLTRNSYTDEVHIGSMIFAIAATPLGIVMIICSAIHINMWNLYPQIKAYEMILNWIGGS